MADMSVIEEENKLILTFEEEEPFDANIFIVAQDQFVKLTPTRPVIVEAHGLIPIVLLSYIAEVSKHCELILEIFDDENAHLYIQQIKEHDGLQFELINHTENK